MVFNMYCVVSSHLGHDYDQDIHEIEFEPMEIDGTPSRPISKGDTNYLQAFAKKIRNANHELGRLSDSSVWRKHFRDNRIRDFQQKALQSKSGYTIRNSDLTGETELYITGPGRRKRTGDASKSKYLALEADPDAMQELVEFHDVDTVYASHGGEEVLQLMDTSPDVKKIVIKEPKAKKTKASAKKSTAITVKPNNTLVAHSGGTTIQPKGDSAMTKFRKGLREGEIALFSRLPQETRDEMFPAGNPLLSSRDPYNIQVKTELMQSPEKREAARRGIKKAFEFIALEYKKNFGGEEMSDALTRIEEVD
ncbi:MAG: hypothetical protein QKB75_gp4 [Bacilladnaviridae sp.]|uniref:Uncharacterized protein n=1 Tax=Bacilladnaviridae sp. isolate ctia23 TaxID=3070178 RepID=A0A345N328_9VIRU|nr:MAG: hypothetical protein QKB75_gp4 [Bacilladnaviridae sp.]AXH78028.1 MAG: hypothetical protein [Bacilladnaviridae sp. isolate ctia23]